MTASPGLAFISFTKLLLFLKAVFVFIRVKSLKWFPILFSTSSGLNPAAAIASFLHRRCRLRRHLDALFLRISHDSDELSIFRSPTLFIWRTWMGPRSLRRGRLVPAYWRRSLGIQHGDILDMSVGGHIVLRSQFPHAHESLEPAPGRSACSTPMPIPLP